MYFLKTIKFESHVLLLEKCFAASIMYGRTVGRLWECTLNTQANINHAETHVRQAHQQWCGWRGAKNAQWLFGWCLQIQNTF